jgi:hypothetical protein
MTMNHSPITSDRGTPAVTFGDAFPMGFTYDALPMRVRFGPSGVSQFRSFGVRDVGVVPGGLFFRAPRARPGWMLPSSPICPRGHRPLRLAIP